MSAQDLAIAGFVPFSTVDWPGKLVATIFLQGCPWQCGYCQNPGLIDPFLRGSIPWVTVRETLGRRAGLLDAVVFSGGEPLRQAAIRDAVAEVKAAGFMVALHTSGAYPARLRELLPDLDWVGLDIKAPPRRYAAVTGVNASGEKAWNSLDHVVASGVAYEVRLTVDPVALTVRDVEDVVAELGRRGSIPPVLQEARAEGTRPDYAAALADRRLENVVPAAMFPELERRVSLGAGPSGTSVRQALAARDAPDDGPVLHRV